MWRVNGKEIRRRRIERMLDQPELARVSGVSLRRLRTLESGDARCTRSTLACLAKPLRCELGDIGRPEDRAEHPYIAGRPAIVKAASGGAQSAATRPRMDDLRAMERKLPRAEPVEHDGASVPKLTVLAYQQCFTAYRAHAGELYWIEGIVAGERGLPPPEASLIGAESGEGARFDVRCPVGKSGHALAVTVHTAGSTTTLAMQRHADERARFVARVVAPKAATDALGLTFFMRERPSPWGLVVVHMFDDAIAERNARPKREPRAAAKRPGGAPHAKRKRKTRDG